VSASSFRIFLLCFKVFVATPAAPIAQSAAKIVKDHVETSFYHFVTFRCTIIAESGWFLPAVRRVALDRI
jgi:hypothetical protein